MDSNSYCKNHSDHLIDLYCVDCKKCMCLKCKVTSHEGHKAETIAFGTEQLTQEIIKKLFVVIKDIKELRYQENCLKKQINVVQTKSNAEKQHYKDTKEDDISRIEERYKANIQRLDETEKHNLKEIEVAKEKIQAQIDVKQNITDLCEATMATASGSSLLMGLTEGLIQKVSEEEQKVVGNTSVTLWHPKHHVLDYWNYPSFYDEFKIFSPWKVRELNMSFHEIISQVQGFADTSDLKGYPHRLGIVNNGIWIPSNTKALSYEVFNISTKTPTSQT